MQRIVNPDRPFNVGDEIFAGFGAPVWHVNSWNPGARTVRVMSPRKHVLDVPWKQALALRIDP